MPVVGIVFNVFTHSIEPNRRPTAYGKTEEELRLEQPQIFELLRTEFQALVIGYLDGDESVQILPPQPARIHSFVYLCSDEQVRAFTRTDDYLRSILNTSKIPTDELVIAVFAPHGARARTRAVLFGADGQGTVAAPQRTTTIGSARLSDGWSTDDGKIRAQWSASCSWVAADRSGVITKGSLVEGLEMKLDPEQNVEDMKAGKFVVIEGDKNDFFSMVTDMRLDANNQEILLHPPGQEDALLRQVLAGTSTYNIVSLRPMLMMPKGRGGRRRPRARSRLSRATSPKYKKLWPTTWPRSSVARATPRAATSALAIRSTWTRRSAST